MFGDAVLAFAGHRCYAVIFAGRILRFGMGLKNQFKDIPRSDAPFGGE
jgi:hypothetical protein